MNAPSFEIGDLFTMTHGTIYVRVSDQCLCTREFSQLINLWLTCKNTVKQDTRDFKNWSILHRNVSFCKVFDTTHIRKFKPLLFAGLSSPLTKTKSEHSKAV